MANPRLNPVILLSPVEEGYVAYDPALDRLHQLNPMAALLTELCDGSHSVEDLRALAGPLLPQGQIGEIDRWIDEGLKVGLLVHEDSESAGGREMSAAELSALTKRLRESGKVQTAYLCGKRTVELEPEDWNAWYDLGEIAQCVGRRGEAREAYQKYLDAHPEDGEIEHLLIALRDDAPPPRASDRAIQHIYKNFAESYESRMLGDLKYVGPERIQDALTAVIGDRSGLNVLDLGCGSGLEGVNIRPRAAHLIGIDLSPEMIELARARNIYDRLEVAEITQWLDQGDALFDLVVCCDCLIYFGDLSQIMTAAARRIKPGGHFAMSMERGDRHPFYLTDTGSPFATVDLIKRIASEGKLDLRLWMMLNDSNENLRTSIQHYRLQDVADHHLTVRAIKRYADGALGSRGAWMLAPYSDLPSSSGMNTEKMETIRETAGIAIANGFQLCVHAIGDRANREVLNIYEETFKAHPDKHDLRWRIEHAQHLDPADIPRFGQLGVIAAMQGIHCTSDAPYVILRLGEKRAEAGAYAWRSLLDSGAVVGNGTDAPVEEVNPIACFYASVTRRTKDGTQFFPKQCMTRLEALRSYTLSNAFAAFEDDQKGSLVAGKLADITVLSRDILTVPEDQIAATRIVYTIVGGKIVYQGE